MKGTLDYIGLNHYGSNTVLNNPYARLTGAYFEDIETSNGSIEDGVSDIFLNVCFQKLKKMVTKFKYSKNISKTEKTL